MKGMNSPWYEKSIIPIANPTSVSPQYMTSLIALSVSAGYSSFHYFTLF